MSAATTPSNSTNSGGLWATGIASFAGILLVMIAMFQIIAGIAAIAEDEVYLVGAEYTYAFDITTWGWVHLVIGIIGAAVGLAILAGQDWGRVGGITIAVISTVANFAFMPYYPFWALAIMVFNVLVIWALATQLAGSASNR